MDLIGRINRGLVPAMRAFFDWTLRSRGVMRRQSYSPAKLFEKTARGSCKR